MNDRTLGVVCGGAIVFQDAAEGTRRQVAKYTSPRNLALSLDTALGIPIINARFFHREVFDRIGLFDYRSYSISADRDFLLRAALAGVKSMAVDSVIYHYRKHVGSLTFSDERAEGEILEQHLLIAESCLGRVDIKRQDRRAIKRWHSREAIACVARGFRGGELSSGVKYVLRGWSVEVYWPILFGKYLLRWLFRAVAGRLLAVGRSKAGA